MSRQYIFIIVVVVVLAGGILAYFLSQGNGAEPEIVAPENGEEATTIESTLPLLLEQVGAGQVGEVLIEDEATGEEAPLIEPEMPLIIPSTTGTILEIGNDSIIIMGSGSNFADRISRKLNCLFAEKTYTFFKGQTKYYQGLEGLNYLKQGMEIAVNGNGNIRGKTEFEVKTINVLR